MSNKNDSRTKAFEAVNHKASHANRSRQRIVIAIFVVVILILAAFATLIIGKIVNDIEPSPVVPSNKDMTYVPKDAGDIKIGNLLFINDEFEYQFPADTSNIVNLWEFKNNSANNAQTTIAVGSSRFPTYELYGVTHANRITLDATALDMFNLMLLDYCKTLDLSDHTDGSASNLTIAWGCYDNVDEYEQDLASSSYGKDYYDHALGTVLTLRTSLGTVITEQILKNDYTWLYENAYKYGYIIRFPNACKDHTGYDSATRVHLRYVGVEHATYIYQNGICLEKYLETLRTQYSSDTPLSITANGKTYQVYYVKYTGNPTSIPVPKDATYSISGDNMNGFIVTVEE